MSICHLVKEFLPAKNLTWDREVKFCLPYRFCLFLNCISSGLSVIIGIHKDKNCVTMKFSYDSSNILYHLLDLLYSNRPKFYRNNCVCFYFAFSNCSLKVFWVQHLPENAIPVNPLRPDSCLLFDFVGPQSLFVSDLVRMKVPIYTSRDNLFCPFIQYTLAFKISFPPFYMPLNNSYFLLRKTFSLA